MSSVPIASDLVSGRLLSPEEAGRGVLCFGEREVRGDARAETRFPGGYLERGAVAGRVPEAAAVSGCAAGDLVAALRVQSRSEAM